MRGKHHKPVSPIANSVTRLTRHLSFFGCPRVSQDNEGGLLLFASNRLGCDWSGIPESVAGFCFATYCVSPTDSLRPSMVEAQESMLKAILRNGSNAVN